MVRPASTWSFYYPLTQESERRESSRHVRRLEAEKEALQQENEALSSQLGSAKQDFAALSARVRQQDEENDQLQVPSSVTCCLHRTVVFAFCQL